MVKRVSQKPRDEWIYATTKGIVDEIVFSIEPHSSDLQFKTEMKNVYSEVSYDRPKAPKIQSRLPQDHPTTSFNSSKALERNFDFYCAVDTNTRELMGKRVSTVGIVVFQHAWIGGRNGLEPFWQFKIPFCLEYVELKFKPENFGWMSAYNQLMNSGEARSDQRIAIVVDSDLRELHDYNQRTKPIFENVFLPKNVILIYASGEVGMENVLNKSLAVAHSVADQSLDAVERGIAQFNNKSFGVPWCKGFRIIRPL